MFLQETTTQCSGAVDPENDSLDVWRCSIHAGKNLHNTVLWQTNGEMNSQCDCQINKVPSNPVSTRVSTPQSAGAGLGGALQFDLIPSFHMVIITSITTHPLYLSLHGSVYVLNVCVCVEVKTSKQK